MEMGVTIAAAALLILCGATLLLALLKGRGEYNDYVEPLDEKEFRLKGLLPAGLLLDNVVSIGEHAPSFLRQPLRSYNCRVTAKVTEIYGEKERDYYETVHRAGKWVMALLAAAFLAMFALISCSNGEYQNAALFTVASPVALVAAPFVMDRDLDSKIEKRREQIQMEFPEFVNKLILLVNAGSTISRAWEKIVSESKSDSPLFRELRVCSADIQSGTPEAVAYEAFARRCQMKEVIKFVSVIILNLRKGGSEIVPTLRSQADDCWEARKATARRLGEKASSKLLGPMAIMLLGIIMIVALPAILALTGM